MKTRKKKAAKALSILLTLLMILCTIPMTAAAETVEFSDTWDHWAKDSIERWSDYGIVNGMPEGYFNPDGGMTRAQAASVFAKLLNLKPARPANFIDVPTYEWYVDPIARVVAAGIMNGMGDGLMNPEGFVSREQFFVMFARALGIHPQESTSGVPADGSDYSTGYINALTDKGFVKGDENGVNALADISRASVVALLDQTISTYANVEGAKVKAAGSGVTLIVADGVTLTGKSDMVAIGVGAEGTKGVTVNDAEIGQLNVLADANVELAGDTKVKAVSVDISADGSKLTVDKNVTVGTIASEASNSTIENKGTVTGAITTTGEKTDVTNSGSVASIDAKGKNTEVSNTGTVSGNISATGTVSNTGTITGNVAATGAVTNKGKVSGSIAQNGEATKPAESGSSGGGGGGGSSGGGGGGSHPVAGVYSITLDAVAKVNGTVSPSKTSSNGNEEITLTVSPAEGYRLKAGTLVVKDRDGHNVAVANNKFAMPNSNVTVYAEFEAVVYTVTAADTSHGTIAVDKATATIGQTVTVTVNTASNYKLETLTYTPAGKAAVDIKSAKSFTMPAGNVTVNATFVALPAPTASQISTAENNTLPALTVGYSSGNTVDLTAAAVSGITFSYAEKTDADDCFSIDAAGLVTFAVGKAAGTYTGVFTITAQGDGVRFANETATKDVTVTVTVNAAAPVHTHSLTYHAAVSATCTTAGNSEYWSCDCGKYFNNADGADNHVIAADSWVIPATGHNLTEHAVVAATCTTEGHSAYWECSRCHKFFDNSQGIGVGAANADGFAIAATGHSNPLEYHAAVAATCTTAGNREYWYCTACQKYFDNAQGTGVGAANADGFAIAATGHSNPLEYHAAVPAGETEDGYIEYWECSTCHAYFGNEAGTIIKTAGELVVPATGHTHVWGAATYNWAPDNATVTAIRVCTTDANHKETETVNTTSTVTPAACTVAGNTHYTATFTNGAFTTQEKDVAIAALGHNMTAHPEGAATEENPGNRAYWSCDRCNKYFSDENGDTEIVEDSWVTPALGYAITATPAVNGSYIVQVNGVGVTAVTPGATVVVTATPNAGYRTPSVTVSTSGGVIAGSTENGVRSFTMPHAAVTITVGFESIPATQPTITAGPANHDLANNYSATTLSVTATPIDGHTLSYQWYSNTTNSTENGTTIGTNSNEYTIEAGGAAGTTYYYCVVTATRDDNSQTATATSAIATVTIAPATYTASVAAGIEHGTVTVSPDTAVVAGTPITVTVTPAEHYTLTTLTVGAANVTIGTGESQVPASGGTYTFSITADTEVNATFTEDAKYSITTLPSSVAADKTSNIYAGETVTLTVTPPEHQRVENITANGVACAATANANEYTFLMPAASVTVAVTFTQDIVSSINTYAYEVIAEDTFSASDSYDDAKGWYAAAATALNAELTANPGITLITGNLAGQLMLIDKYGKFDSITDYGGEDENEGTPAKKWAHATNQDNHNTVDLTRTYYATQMFAFYWTNDGTTRVDLYHYNRNSQTLGAKTEEIVIPLDKLATWGNSFTANAAGEGITSTDDYAVVIGSTWYVFHYDTSTGITAVNP